MLLQDCDTFLALSTKSIAWYVAIKLEAWLNGGKFEGCKISEVDAYPTKEQISTWQGTSFAYTK
jgi:hypothetical protein